MAVAFTPGQVLGRGDLDIFLTNADGNPANAYSITYALYFVDPATQVEVLVGPSAHTPVNPSVGEYYAAIMVPTSAQPGTYRIRWTFQQYSSEPAQTVVQEWAVVATGTNTGNNTTQYSQCITDLVGKLRLLTRDNCLAGETQVEVMVNGVVRVVSLEDLFDAVGEMSPPPP